MRGYSVKPNSRFYWIISLVSAYWVDWKWTNVNNINVAAVNHQLLNKGLWKITIFILKGMFILNFVSENRVFVKVWNDLDLHKQRIFKRSSASARIADEVKRREGHAFKKNDLGDV